MSSSEENSRGGSKSASLHVLLGSARLLDQAITKTPATAVAIVSTANRVTSDDSTRKRIAHRPIRPKTINETRSAATGARRTANG